MFPGWIVAGLGNPGRQYAGTRHDLGFMLVDRLAARFGGSFGKAKEAEVTKPVRLGDGQALLVKPMAYMNLSGPPLQGLMARERVPVERVLVACDDVNIPLGKLRLRPSGSAGGHNGLRSIIECVGEGFPRLRLGIGQEPAGMDRADFVLRRFTPDERKAVDEMLDRAEQVVEVVVGRGLDAAKRLGGL